MYCVLDWSFRVAGGLYCVVDWNVLYGWWTVMCCWLKYTTRYMDDGLSSVLDCSVLSVWYSLLCFWLKCTVLLVHCTALFTELYSRVLCGGWTVRCCWLNCMYCVVGGLYSCFPLWLFYCQGVVLLSLQLCNLLLSFCQVCPPPPQTLQQEFCHRFLLKFVALSTARYLL
jgi:hypothetical protein